jgi:hypothetical protein
MSEQRTIRYPINRPESSSVWGKNRVEFKGKACPTEGGQLKRYQNEAKVATDKKNTFE